MNNTRKSYLTIFNLKYLILLILLIYSFFVLRNTPPFALSGTNVAFKILLASIQVLFIPGYLLFELVQKREKIEMDLFELSVISFGISISIIEILCIIAIEAKLNSTAAGLYILTFSLFLLLFNFFQDRKLKIHFPAKSKPPFDKTESILYILAIIAMVITAFLLYKIESPVLSGEDQLHISVIRKILENPVLAKNNILYKPETIHTYLYPGLHFMFALISLFSNLDPIIVYAKLRFVLGVFSLMVIWSFSKALFKSKYITFAIFSACLALIYNGMAGSLPGFYCGQLIPVSHVGDISMGLLLPLTLIFTFKYVEGEGFLNWFFIFSLLVCISALISHTREIVQVLFYYTATMVAYLIFKREDKKIIYKMLLIIFCIISLGFIYKHIHSINVLDVKTLEQNLKEKEMHVLIGLSKNIKLALSNPSENLDVKYFVAAGKLIFKKYVTFAMPMALFILVFFRRRFWVLFLSSSIIASMVIMRFNILAMLMVVLTYSEILFTPGRFILYFAYILFGFFVYLVVAGLNSLFLYFKSKLKLKLPLFWIIAAAIFVLLFSLTAILGFVDFIQWGIYKHANRLLGGLAIVTLVLLATNLFKEKISQAGDYILNNRPRYISLWLVSLVCLLLPVYLYGGYENTRIFDVPRRYEATNIINAYKARITEPDVSNFKEYSTSTGILHLPWEVVNFIRNQVPAGNVFAFNVHRKHAPIFIPFFANQYLAAAPNDLSFLWIRNSDDNYLNTFKDNRQIIFNDSESDRERLDFLKRFNFTYILVDPEFYYLTNFLNRYGCFVKVYDKDDFAIYKINRESLLSLKLRK